MSNTHAFDEAPLLVGQRVLAHHARTLGEHSLPRRQGQLRLLRERVRPETDAISKTDIKHAHTLKKTRQTSVKQKVV